MPKLQKRIARTNAKGSKRTTRRLPRKSTKQTNSKRSLNNKMFSGTNPATMKLQQGPRVKAGVHESICALVNPFCTQARAAKWPDGLGANTLTYQLRGRVNVGTNVDGGALIGFVGSLPYGYYTSTYLTGNYTFSSTGSDITASSSFTNIYDTYRIVSWGVIVRSLLPALTAQGLLCVRKYTSAFIAGDVIAAGSTVGTEYTVHPIYAGLEVPIIGKPKGVLARSFGGRASLVNPVDYWDTPIIELVGGPASTASVISIEYVYNVEFTLVESQLALHQMQKPDAPNAPKTVEVANVAYNRIQATAMQTLEKFGSHVLSSVEGAAEDVLTGAMAFLGL